MKIDHLAEELNTNKSYISKALNKNDKNFNYLVNDFRIKHFLADMENAENSKYSIQYLYNKAGFKHQSTFNRAFKKIVGITPSEYFKNQMSSSQDGTDY